MSSDVQVVADSEKDVETQVIECGEETQKAFDVKLLSMKIPTISSVITLYYNFVVLNFDRVTDAPSASNSRGRASSETHRGFERKKSVGRE